MLKTLLLFLIIQFNDTIIEDLMSHVQQKYGTDSTFVKMTKNFICIKLKNISKKIHCGY